jgi:hypothetical protein
MARESLTMRPREFRNKLTIFIEGKLLLSLGEPIPKKFDTVPYLCPVVGIWQQSPG